MSGSEARGTPPRLLHIAAGNLYGGVESQLRALAECQARGLAPGLEMEFAVCFPGRLADVLRTAGAVVHELGPMRYSRPWTVWRARRRLAQVVTTRRIDALVAHACWAHCLAAPVARRRERASIFWAHDLLGGDHWIEHAASRFPPDLAVANSQITATTIPTRFPHAPIEIVHNVVPRPTVDRASARADIRAALGVSETDVVLVAVTRFERCKGLDLLVEALGRLRGKPAWTCWIAGGIQRPHEQLYLSELTTQARALGVDDRLRFLGQRDDVPRLLAAADIHCQPNTAPESFGIAFVEALYASLPVITTRLGGAIEIVTDDCGRLLPPGDAAVLADTLSTLIDDPASRRALGAAGPARAAALCAPEVVLPRLEAVVCQAVTPALV